MYKQFHVYFGLNAILFLRSNGDISGEKFICDHVANDFSSCEGVHSGPMMRWDVWFDVAYGAEIIDFIYGHFDKSNEFLLVARHWIARFWCVGFFCLMFFWTAATHFLLADFFQPSREIIRQCATMLFY